MYGMSHHSLQLNYLPNTLKPLLPPTDTRFRPDQRALENGDLKLAAEEKHRLEEKQRAVRRYNEKHKIEHTPKYFEEWKNPDDPDQVYYRYNGKYFEEDRPKKDWSRLPDIYSDELPPEIVEFEKSNKKK
jgi:oxysterol-binding protein 1